MNDCSYIIRYSITTENRKMTEKADFFRKGFGSPFNDFLYGPCYSRKPAAGKELPEEFPEEFSEDFSKEFPEGKENLVPAGRVFERRFPHGVLC